MHLVSVKTELEGIWGSQTLSWSGERCFTRCFPPVTLVPHDAWCSLLPWSEMLQSSARRSLEMQG